MQTKKPSPTLLPTQNGIPIRPSLPPAHQLPGEPRPFIDRSIRNLTPPQHSAPRTGPEQTYAISVTRQLSRILTEHHIVETPALITTLLRWRRA